MPLHPTPSTYTPAIIDESSFWLDEEFDTLDIMPNLHEPEHDVEDIEEDIVLHAGDSWKEGTYGR